MWRENLVSSSIGFAHGRRDRGADKMPAAQSGKFFRLDAARGFVALYVVFGHTFYGQLGAADPLLRFGQEAVMAFFVISGFVIMWTTSGIGSKREFSSYFFKRFARIYSVWVPGVVLLVLIASIEAGRLVLESPERFLGNALMLQDVPNMKPAVMSAPLYGVSPLWTLHYEWWFYMLFPLALLWLPRKDNRHHVIGLLAVASAFVYVVWPNPLSRLFVYFAIWWLGVRAAVVLREKGAIRFRDMHSSLLYVAAAALPLIGLAVYRWSAGQELMAGKYPLLEVRHLLGAVILVVFAFLWRRAGWIGFGWTVGVFALAAPISYAIYLVHYNSIAHATYFSFVGNRWLELALYFAVTLVFCYLAEVLFYPWFRRWLEKRGWIATRSAKAGGTGGS